MHETHRALAGDGILAKIGLDFDDGTKERRIKPIARGVKMNGAPNFLFRIAWASAFEIEAGCDRRRQQPDADQDGGNGDLPNTLGDREKVM